MANWEVEEPPIVSREQWGALPYTSSEPVNHPVNFIRFQYTGLETCTNKKECFKFLQDMQKEHMEKHNLPDIQYNFLVSSEGDIYEGRGWNRCAYREGKHDHVWRNDMINIGYIGYFKLTPLPMKMEAATVELLAWGLQSNYILKGCVSFPHRHFLVNCDNNVLVFEPANFQLYANELIGDPRIYVCTMDLQKLQKIHQEKTAFGESITFTYCPRDVWGAQPPSAVPGEEIKHPVSNVRYMDTGTDTCVTPKDCAKVLQKMQKDHMENEKLSDIKYNFLVGGDGTIYEGRGWLVDAHRPNDFDHLKGNCIDVAYIGNMKDKEQRRRGFPTPDSEKYAYGWSVYGQKDKNYVEYPFTVIQ